MSTAAWIPILLEKICVLVTLAFLLTRTRLVPDLRKARLSRREQAIATVLFLLLGFVEVVTSLQPSMGLSSLPLNLRIVAVAAAGLLAGPWVGLIVGVGVTLMATLAPGAMGMPVPIGISMIVGGVAAGALRNFRPALAIRPFTGLMIGMAVSLLRDLLNFLFDGVKVTTFGGAAEAAILQGVSVALILLVISQACAQESQAKAAAMAEVRALQARMDPHFIFNSLNLLSALSEVDPPSVATAAAHLGKFLRAAIDQHDQVQVPLEQELAIVDSYLEIERLRFGERLTVTRNISAQWMRAKVPPFLLQPLVENAVCHGIQPTAEGGMVRITVQRADGKLVLTVSDNGIGMPSGPCQQVSISRDGHLHALAIMRRRLESLYGSRFTVEFRSLPGEGTTVSVSIPYEDFDPAAKEQVVALQNAIPRLLHEGRS